jgi:hypothetical protein
MEGGAVKPSWKFLVGVTLVAAVLAGAIAGVAASRGEAAATVPSASPTAAPAQAPAWLSSLAAQNAASNGDADPALVKWGLLKMKEAAPLLGGLEDVPYEYVDRQMYVVVMQGHFVDEMAFRPSGAKAPTGWCIVDVIDPQTKGIVGYTLWPDELKMDMSKVGSLQPLELAPVSQVE